jgi:protein-disulfide isomerase
MIVMRLMTFALLLPGLVLAQQKAAAPTFNKTFGPSTAPVTIEVFSDFQCPACKNLHDNVLKPLTVDYVRTGKVRLIYRDFPLPMHPHARQAAQYAVAASRIDKYEAVADALWRAQSTWSQNGAVEATVASALPPADLQKVKTLMRDPSVEAAIEADVALGKENRVQQTPTMVITRGIRRYPVAGNVSYGVVKQFLDDLLKK